MKLPKRLKVGPTYFIFKRHNPVLELAGLMGRFDPQSNEIYILEDGIRTEGQTKETLMHELIHAGCYLSQMNRMPPDEEDLVSRLSMALMTIFHDNPKLKEALF